MELNELKNYLRIDHSIDDNLINLLKETAEDYILNAIENTAKAKTDKRFAFAVALLVANWYENRSDTTANSTNQIPIGVRSLITQLRGL